MGVFANTLTASLAGSSSRAGDRARGRWNLAGWLLTRLRSREHTLSRLNVVERVSLAQRQSLALVEADGQRLLVATSAEGAPVFFPLGESARRPRRTGATESKQL